MTINEDCHSIALRAVVVDELNEADKDRYLQEIETATLDPFLCDERSTFPVVERFPPAAKDDFDVMSAAVQKQWQCHRHASAELLRDFEFLLQLLHAEPASLQFLGPEASNDKKLVLAAVSNRGFALCAASEDLKADIDVVLTAVKQNPDSLQFASHSMRANKDIVLEAVRRNPKSVDWASDSLLLDPEVLCYLPVDDDRERTITTKVIDKISGQTMLTLDIGREDFWLSTIEWQMRKHWQLRPSLAAQFSLPDATVPLDKWYWPEKSCRELTLEATFNPRLSKDQKSLYLNVVECCRSPKQAVEGVKHFPLEARDDRDVMRKALEKSRECCKHLSWELRNDLTFLRDAVARDPRCLRMAGEELRGDRGLVLLACRQDPACLRFASQSLKQDEDFQREVAALNAE